MFASFSSHDILILSIIIVLHFSAGVDFTLSGFMSKPPPPIYIHIMIYLDIKMPYVCFLFKSWYFDLSSIIVLNFSAGVDFTLSGFMSKPPSPVTFSALLAICAGNSRSPMNSPHKGQWRGALMFSLICVLINDWVNNREAGDLRRYRAHYDVTVMVLHWSVTLGPSGHCNCPSACLFVYAPVRLSVYLAVILPDSYVTALWHIQFNYQIITMTSWRAR